MPGSIHPAVGTSIAAKPDGCSARDRSQAGRSQQSEPCLTRSAAAVQVGNVLCDVVRLVCSASAKVVADSVAGRLNGSRVRKRDVASAVRGGSSISSPGETIRVGSIATRASTVRCIGPLMASSRPAPGTRTGLRRRWQRLGIDLAIRALSLLNYQSWRHSSSLARIIHGSGLGLMIVYFAARNAILDIYDW